MLCEIFNGRRCKDEIVICNKRKCWYFFVVAWLTFYSSNGVAASEEKIVLRVPMPKETVTPFWIIDKDNNDSPSGFLPALYQELEDYANVIIETVPVGIEYLLDTHGETFRLIDENVIDMGAQMSFPLDRDFSYTIPVKMQYFHALIVQQLADKSFLQVFEPFTYKLWLVLIGAILFGSLIHSLIIRMAYRGQNNKVNNMERRMVFDFYSTITTLLGGGDAPDFDEVPLLRLYYLGLLFFALIITSTYTANLAAFLTRQDNVLIGPTTMKELKESNVCMIWKFEEQMQIIDNFVKSISVPPTMNSQEQGQKWALDQLLVYRNCSAIVVSDSDSVRILSENQCENLYEPPGIEFAPTPIFHTMRTNTTEEKETFHRINDAITRIISSPKYNDLMNTFFSSEETCGSKKSSNDNEQDFSGSGKIGIKEMLIPILVYISISVLTLILSFSSRFKTNHRSENNKADEKQMTTNASSGENAEVIVSNDHIMKLEQLLGELRNVVSNHHNKPIESFMDHPDNNINSKSDSCTLQVRKTVSFNTPFVRR